ncbi:group I intron-associated PD-(D/E)XK endonuclease [Alkalimonas delamerensis]|uniref:Group I intron-associated PD-(D/E)XK endonuclease n=1 Tax=Alkalimonas delamerensis TaxID=265981 RepID=A0ABT9GTT3_9GAMM|nr:group I intron-associated PD-(D/E)XK endonuclease [Alkalimonas delamerensis]MDP4530386.1 group I intron-associated PD-(D/E)XK endonuclease [Alkalimonas delamerensis]
MPLKSSALASEHQRHYQSHSFEQYAAGLFMADGWEVFQPALDHGRKTDLVISDGDVFYRVQIKSLETTDESVLVKNLWKNSDTKIDYVIYFSQKGNWGYIIKPFAGKQRSLKCAGGVRFHKHPRHFAQAFAKI